MDLWGREEGREFRTLACTWLYQYNPTKVDVQGNQAQAKQWEALQGNRLDVGNGSHMQGMGPSLAWDCSTAPCPCPENVASLLPWLAGGDEKYTSTLSIPSHLFCSPQKDCGEPSQVPFGSKCVLIWLEGGWTACMSYQSPSEWVETLSEDEICHDTLESTRDISKQQNLLEIFFEGRSLTQNGEFEQI